MNNLWLIRTSDKEILGPYSKDHVIDLLNKGNIKQCDEVCSGNGFWFYLREKEFVDKYLYGNSIQPFNPVQEAKSVLTNDDIAFEEPSVESPDITLLVDGDAVKEAKNIEVESFQNTKNQVLTSEIKLPSADDLEYPEMGDLNIPPPELPSEKKLASSSQKKIEDDKILKKLERQSRRERLKETMFKGRKASIDSKTQKNLRQYGHRNDLHLFFWPVMAILILVFALYIYYGRVVNG